MRDSTGWKRSRWVALALVVALHTGMVVALLRLHLSSRSLEPGPLSLLLVPPIRQPRPPIAEPSAGHPAVRESMSIRLSPPLAPSISTPTAPEAETPQAIDWARELDATVRSRSTAAAEASTPSRPAPLVAPHLPAPPLHQRGDSSTAPSGETTVWLSENCYQVFGLLLTVPDTFAHSMLPRTSCIRQSKTPRGDLFKDLPAYKKLHPDEGVP